MPSPVSADYQKDCLGLAKRGLEKYIVLGMELLPNNRDEQPQKKPSVPPSMQSKNQPVYEDESDLPF